MKVISMNFINFSNCTAKPERMLMTMATWNAEKINFLSPPSLAFYDDEVGRDGELKQINEE
jgi:hypothetical protein